MFLNPMNKIEILDREYTPALCRDIPPNEESALGIEIRNNPKLLASSVTFTKTDHSSLIYQAIYIGSLRFIDFIVKRNNEFVMNANPFYCGMEEVEMHERWLESPGLNFYYALMLFQFYDAQGKLTDIVEIGDNAELIRIKRTYWNEFYWEDQSIRRSVSIDTDVDTDIVLEYKKKVVPWFIEQAYEIFQKECELARLQSLRQPTESLQISLAIDYMHIVYMENTGVSSRYFLDKVTEYCHALRVAFEEKSWTDDASFSREEKAVNAVCINSISALEYSGAPLLLSLDNLDGRYNEASLKVSVLRQQISLNVKHDKARNASGSTVYEQGKTWYSTFSRGFSGLVTSSSKLPKVKNS